MRGCEGSSRSEVGRRQHALTGARLGASQVIKKEVKTGRLTHDQLVAHAFLLVVREGCLHAGRLAVAGLACGWMQAGQAGAGPRRGPGLL